VHYFCVEEKCGATSHLISLLLKQHIYKCPQNESLAKAMFSICNGPIAGAVVMWRNSLVFHSMDKMTSMFIHMLPPIVTFCRRWDDHLSKKEFPLFEEMDDTVYANITEFWWNPLVYYAIWQAIYLIKTEWWSKEKLQYNPELMTSLRWLTHKKHSSSYKLLSYFGEQHQLVTFVLIQAIYTLLTFLMMPLLWHSIWLHGAYLVMIFIIALANGAMYYFHVFAVRYIEEVGKRVSEEQSNAAEK
jgi:magnesium-transporting ATPase (P-type)